MLCSGSFLRDKGLLELDSEAIRMPALRKGWERVWGFHREVFTEY